VNRALGQVFRLLAQRRISRQEAATFGHLAQLLLRTISLMRAEATASTSENKQPMIPEPATAVNSSAQPEIPAAACEPTPIPRTPSPASTQEPFAASNPVARNPRTINTSAAFVSNSSEINTSENDDPIRIVVPSEQREPRDLSQDAQNQQIRRVRLQGTWNEQLQIS
jgi:hypothetical protein